MDGDPALADEIIEERIAHFETGHGSGGDIREFATYLVEYCSGEVAEKAVRRLVELLPDDALNPLVHRVVLRWGYPYQGAPYGHRTYAGSVAPRLLERGFSPVRLENGSFRVGIPGVAELAGPDLCRMALILAWLHRMRSEDVTTSPTTEP